MEIFSGSMRGLILLFFSGLYQSACLSRRRELLRLKPYGYCSHEDEPCQIRPDPRGKTDNDLSYPPMSAAASSSSRKREASLIASPKSSFQDKTNQWSSRSRMWPPWPFNLLDRDQRQATDDTTNYVPSHQNDASQALTRVTLLWEFLTQSAQAGLRNMQYATSQLLFHLPPAAPPLILLACLPQRRPIKPETLSTATQVPQALRTYMIPLVSDPFARNVALSFLGLAVMSWAHSQIHRKRLLTQLPLAPELLDVNRAVLPPFLPEEEPHDYAESVWTELEGDEDVDEQLLTKSRSTPLLQLTPFWDGAPDPRTFQSTWNRWKQMRLNRQRNQRNANRLAVMEQLIALQQLKKRKRHDERTKGRSKRSDHQQDPKKQEEATQMGYALVTGASRGIGRAIAVELSRWGIPLILVARDIERLTSLAFDLKLCYGVDCCILQADLSKPGVGEAVYEAVREADLPVDILVNNAGLSSQGFSVDLPIKQVDDMISVNIQAVSTLTHLFAKDMKARRRGRILMVSSVCGAVSGIPTVAVYSATKAFEKTLSTSLAKEMESFGVGVTCLLPGAVRDTDFRSRSNSRDAICWKLPFYLKFPHQVAEMGVRALLRGETEVTPGWMNRLFLKVMQPALPPRIHNLIAETMWNPFQFPFSKQSDSNDSSSLSRRDTESPLRNSTNTRRVALDSLPRLLQLGEDFSSLDTRNSPDIPSPIDSPGDGNATETSQSTLTVESLPELFNRAESGNNENPHSDSTSLL